MDGGCVTGLGCHDQARDEEPHRATSHSLSRAPSLSAKLTTADIDDFFYGHLLRRGGKDERPLAPGTVQRTHVVLHRALAQAVRWDWIWVNPASQSSPPRAVPPEVRPPSPEVVTKLLSYVARRDRAFHLFLVLAALAATTGETLR